MRKKLAYGIALLGVATHNGVGTTRDGRRRDWRRMNGVSFVTVTADPAAPNGNFGTPGTTNTTAYEVRMRADANYLYTAINSIGGNSGGLNFANLYYSLRYGSGPVGANGSGIGVEVTNDRAFLPAGAGYFNDVGGSNGGLIQWASTTGGVDVLEVAIDLSVFLGNALGVTGYGGLPPGELLAGIRLNLSQSFGYAVAGGQANYGDTRLGFVPLAATTVPEPSTYALMGAGLLALGVAARRRRKRLSFRTTAVPRALRAHARGARCFPTHATRISRHAPSR